MCRRPIGRYSSPSLETSGKTVEEWLRCLQAGEKKSLDIFLYGNVFWVVPRAATTSDPFNAVAEPRRREILNYLAMQERPVGEIVAALGLEQPSVSKHLRVLRNVGLVRVRREGRKMLYSLDAEAIRPMYEWTQTFERFWKHQLQRVKERAEERAAAPKDPGKAE